MNTNAVDPTDRRVPHNLAVGHQSAADFYLDTQTGYDNPSPVTVPVGADGRARLLLERIWRRRQLTADDTGWIYGTARVAGKPPHRYRDRATPPMLRVRTRPPDEHDAMPVRRIMAAMVHGADQRGTYPWLGRSSCTSRPRRTSTSELTQQLVGRRVTSRFTAAIVAGAILTMVGGCTTGTAGTGLVNGGPADTRTAEGATRVYPQHSDVVATTFWVGEIFDPNASDGSQVISTYDSQWLAHYGGCDGVVVDGQCQTEVRTAGNGYFPTSVTPQENPYYLDLPFDDVNDPGAFARRAAVIPWADDPGYAGRADDPFFSYMKNRWVEITKGDRTCYAQIEDAGPGQYNDAEYVFGTDNIRPKNREFNSAGMDVSPAVNGCLGFSDINGEDDRVDWRFVEVADVPTGPWRTLITTSQVTP